MESVNKRFFRRFKSQYASFLPSIQGISDDTARSDYASLITYRLIVLYFLQQHGLLDNDTSYLFNHLKAAQQSRLPDTFYRLHFIPLCRVLSDDDYICNEPEALLGNLPVSGLPLFQLLPQEVANNSIDIPDAAFARLLAFFDMYQWRLDRQTPQTIATLQPDILAFLFEQNLNRKQTGAYYTRTDVTDYIAKNTIIPYLFSSLKTLHPGEFGTESAIWQLLASNPERYIPPPLSHPGSLPEESEREEQQRRARYERLHMLVGSSTIHHIEDLLTHNLDIQRFAHDAILSCEEPGLLLNLFATLERTTILDPTCGSGAFLFSALNTLEVLYATCLDRLDTLMDATSPPTTSHREQERLYTARYHSLLDRSAYYLNRQHFILTTIIEHNLYGVDLMEEATTICTLRFFLTLLASITRIQDVRPLSALKCNIRVGNALVGCVHPQELPARFTVPSVSLPLTPEQPANHQEDLSGQNEPGADQQKPLYHPFHWSSEFGDIMQRGGFDVIIGNPPYIEYSKIRHAYIVFGYETASCGNLYAAVIERSLALCRQGCAYLGLVVPLSICGGERFTQLRRTLNDHTAALWLANFEIFPCRLFDDAFQRLSLLIAKHDLTHDCRLHVTRIHRWYPSERSHLINSLSYTPTRCIVRPHVFPKLASPLQEIILHKLQARAADTTIASILYARKTEHFVYYQEATNYWMKAICHIPFYKKNGIAMEPPHGRTLFFGDANAAHSIMALMNSSLFYLWFATYSDGFHLSHALVKDFPAGSDLYTLKALPQLALRLEQDILLHTRLSTRNTRPTNGESSEMSDQTPTSHLIELKEYHLSHSKPLLDEIDAVLADYFGLSDEELDFITNYNIKYRMGRDSSERI